MPRNKRSMMLGQGHHGHSSLAPIVDDTDKDSALSARSLQLLALKGMIQPGTKRYHMGQCRIMVSPPVPGILGWHISVSCSSRYPTWDELAAIKYHFCEKIEMVMVFPPPVEYVDIHEYCFHIHEPDGFENGVKVEPKKSKDESDVWDT